MKELIFWLTQPYRGSNRVSRIVRKYIERLPFRQFLGLQLTGVAFFGAIIMPQATDLVSQARVEQAKNQTIIEVVPTTESKLQWPLTRFGLSQQYSAFHPGIDMTSPVGTPIHAVAGGKVEVKEESSVGYGRHVIVQHEDGVTSLYAHLSKFDVDKGQTVTKDTVIGEIGSTGWSTGDHLHLEIYQNQASVNPLEVLPALP
jgi:murein DD-endopeptidase MepM/ murein hydrolase activator NlpD